MKNSWAYALIHFTMREVVITLDWERKVTLYFGALFLATILGPFGTFSTLGFWDRLTFWSIDILGAGFIVHVTVTTLFNAPLFRRVPQVPRLVLAIAIAAVPTTALIRFAYMTMINGAEPGLWFPRLWVEVMLVSFLIFWTEFVLWPRLRRRNAPKGQDTTETGEATLIALPHPPLYDRLPHEAREGEILSISMQDHYAEIAMTNGKHLLLMRLSDAIALLGDTAGTQVHRSHWAAKPHARALHKQGRKTELELSDGRRLPVSASYLKAARRLLE